jgi:hypothetical protein
MLDIPAYLVLLPATEPFPEFHHPLVMTRWTVLSMYRGLWLATWMSYVIDRFFKGPYGEFFWSTHKELFRRRTWYILNKIQDVVWDDVAHIVNHTKTAHHNNLFLFLGEMR